MRNFIRKIIFNRKRGGIISVHNVRMQAGTILQAVKQAESILLHCHPSPDPDSVGSALAMKWVLESMGKKVTVIRGDSELPKGFVHFPGAESILPLSILEVDLNSFDLFIAVDSSNKSQITKKGNLVFPDTLKVINIDHHETNAMYGSVNLVEKTYPACAQVLYELFLEWRVKITKEIAENLYMGLYTDTVEFRTTQTSPKTLFIASKLLEHIPNLPKLIFEMESSETKEYIKYAGLLLSSVETYFNNTFAVASIGLDAIQKNNILRTDMSGYCVLGTMKLVSEWEVMIVMTEIEPNKIKVSTRSKDVAKYDVSKLAETLGGGGHKAAAGILMLMPLEDAKKMIVSKAKELFGLK